MLLLAAAILAEAAIPDPPTSGITTVGSLKLATAADCAGVVAFSATEASVDVSSSLKLIFEQKYTIGKYALQFNPHTYLLKLFRSNYLR